MRVTPTDDQMGLVAPGFGDRLRHARERCEYAKASDFARDSGLDRQTIRRLENGYEPGKKAREAILTALRKRQPIEPRWLFHGEGEPIAGDGHAALARYLNSPLAVGEYAPSREVRAELRKIPWAALDVAHHTPQAIHRLREAIEMNLRMRPR